MSIKITKRNKYADSRLVCTKDQFIMGSEFERAEGMRGFQIASPSILGLRCVKTSFEMIHEATLKLISQKAAIGTNMMIEILMNFFHL